jgi:hypothetical protein
MTTTIGVPSPRKPSPKSSGITEIRLSYLCVIGEFVGSLFVKRILSQSALSIERSVEGSVNVGPQVWKSLLKLFDYSVRDPIRRVQAG